VLGADHRARLIKEPDGTTVLGEAPLRQEFGRPYRLTREVEGKRVRACVDDKPLFDLPDEERPLLGGAVAFVCEEGCLTSDAIEVGPLGPA
jgi:hypothetical protein